MKKPSSPILSTNNIRLKTATTTTTPSYSVPRRQENIIQALIQRCGAVKCDGRFTSLALKQNFLKREGLSHSELIDDHHCYLGDG
jgi:hypothetical protein